MQAEHLSGTQRVRRALRVRSRAPMLVAIGATLLLLALVIGQTIVSQREARARADAGVEALLALHQVMQATLDAETGQRGYLLTGNDAYLEPYRDSRHRLDASLVRLATAMRANDGEGESRRLADLNALVRQKANELDRTVSLARAGRRAEAMAIVSENIGKVQMDAIRSDVRLLIVREERARSDAFERASTLERKLLPLIAVLGIVTLGLVLLALGAERRRTAAEAAVAQADALRAANERANLLAGELNHRVKNLFSTILAIVSLSARKQASTQDVVEDIRARILALSRAHTASQMAEGDDDANIREVIASTLELHVEDDSDRVAIEGPDVEIPVRMVTPLGLIIHELATNAVKYVALSNDQGRVRVAWELLPRTAAGAWVRLSWREDGGPPPAPDGVPRPAAASAAG